LLPTPLMGRALELLALLPAGIAIHREMRSGLGQQIGEASWLRAGAAQALAARLAAAVDWSDGESFPRTLLTHDGMGIAGPSAAAIPRAIQEGVPTLFTGHLPTNSAGDLAVADGKADWIRLPTHPTWPETLDLIRVTRPQVAIAHSCGAAVAQDLAAARPDVIRVAATGESLDLGSLIHAHPHQ
jgi:uncharacterized protein